MDVIWKKYSCRNPCKVLLLDKVPVAVIFILRTEFSREKGRAVVYTEKIRALFSAPTVNSTGEGAAKMLPLKP